jgi:hypothetical protein
VDGLGATSVSQPDSNFGEGTSTDRRTVKFLVAALALSLSPWATAQQDTTSAQSQGQVGATATRTAEITIRGCVSGGKRYTFMQASTGAIFALTGTNRFAPIRGKLVQITANESAPEGKSGELPNLQVNNLRVIAGKCPIQARAASATATLPSADQGQGQLAATSPATERYADPGTVSQTPPNVNNPNIAGDTGAPSPGTGNPPSPPQ